MTRLALAGVICSMLALGGCGGCGGRSHTATSSAPSGPALAEEAVVRLWTKAMYDGRYERAARFFAPRAIVQQGYTRVLRDHADALVFVRGLRCRPSVATIRHESEGVLLVKFDLGPGPRGGCSSGGSARVRFGIHRGLIEGWRQLPDRSGS